MSYYLAPSLAVLWREVKALDPGRDTASDGWIGDAAHASRPSDHNPAPPRGVVRALDLDDDFTTTADKRLVVAELITDSRTAYVITDGRIWKRRTGEWENYHGADNHFSHIHLSILHSRMAEDNTRPWLSPAARPKPKPKPRKDDDMTLDELKKALKDDKELRQLMASAVLDSNTYAGRTTREVLVAGAEAAAAVQRKLASGR